MSAETQAQQPETLWAIFHVASAGNAFMLKSEAAELGLIEAGQRMTEAEPAADGQWVDTPGRTHTYDVFV